MKTIGVDVGGTFTDFVYCDLDTGQVAIHKISTTPDDPSRGILQGIAALCRDNGVEPPAISTTSCMARPRRPTPCWSTKARAPAC